MVAGFHLSLEAPSSVSVGLCLLHAVYDKSAWLDERGIEIPWPVAGLPEILHCDNGVEFRSRALAGACHEYGIKLQFRPPATPRFGGHIERLISTMMGAVHLLPGTTFSNVKIKVDYDAEGGATFTLPELEKWIAIEIAGKYHQRIYTSLLHPPPFRRNLRRYRYSSIFDNFVRHYSQISCSNAREPAHSQNLVQRDTDPLIARISIQTFQELRHVFNLISCYSI
jgi:transposase InsO family protein